MHGCVGAGTYNRRMAIPKDIEESLAKLVRAEDRSTPLVLLDDALSEQRPAKPAP